jgi:hypothetical protein
LLSECSCEFALKFTVKQRHPTQTCFFFCIFRFTIFLGSSICNNLS